MEKVYLKYYVNQIGGGKGVIYNDEFGDLLRLPRVYQRGRGIGGVFSSFWKYLQPLLMSGAHLLKDELIGTGADILQGKKLPDILRDRSTNVIDSARNKVVNKVVNKINTMTGSGRKRKRHHINRSDKRKKLTLCAKKRMIKQTPKRVIDIFS